MTISYSFGDSSTPTQNYTSPADVDVNGDGHADGVYLDFDGSGHKDAIAWDSNGDGRADTILVSSHHDGVYDTAYTDPAGNGHWNEVTTYDASTQTLTVDDSAVHVDGNSYSGEVNTYHVDADGSMQPTGHTAQEHPAPPADSGHDDHVPDTTSHAGMTAVDGSDVTYGADGSVTVHEPDGTALTEEADGSLTYTYSDGATITQEADGDYIYTDSDGHVLVDTNDDNDTSTEAGSQPDQWVSDQQQWADSHGYGS